MLRGVRADDMETTKRGNMTPDTVICGKCGRKIGKYVEIENKVYLQIGVVRLRDGWGWCKCGTEWIWHSSDKQLEHLIERVKLCIIVA